MSVDDLRQQLRERGYLTHGIERWFALDPWSSRTFWSELFIVAAKAAVLLALCGALAPAAVMTIRNGPLGALEILGLFGTYASAWFVAAFLFIVAIALVLKLRPALPIDTPRVLLVLSLVAAAALISPLAFWWFRFDTAPGTVELVTGGSLLVLFFVMATIVVSAALLSFSIYELKRIPAIHQRRRTIPLTAAVFVLIALLFVPAWAERERMQPEPMVVTTPTTNRVALIAVDGLTWEILRSRPDLARLLPHARAAAAIDGDSTAERWASLGTGVPVSVHGVRSIEGIRFRGGSHIIQQVSRADFVLMQLAPRLIARREPLPPTVRRREYLWEIFAERGLTSAAVNWWATQDEHRPALDVAGPERIFAGAHAEPLLLDTLATNALVAAIDKSKPRFASVYLPALDVVLNRLELDPSAKLASSLRALDGLSRAVTLTEERGYDVLLVGMPGDGQRGSAVLASSVPFSALTAWDVAPATLELLGFPASSEMPGGRARTRINSYGPRKTEGTDHPVNQEYYDNLRSLGYIQ